MMTEMVEIMMTMEYVVISLDVQQKQQVSSTQQR